MMGVKPRPIVNIEIDELLHLGTRGAFNRDLTERGAASQELGEPLALVMADVDKFKPINDTHGHPAGDEVLQSVSTVFKQSVGGKGTCYRYGGDELSILLPNYTADEAAALAERIRIVIESLLIGSKHLRVTGSFGVAEIPTHAQSPTDLLERADSALYEAKNLGRNLVRISGETKPVAAIPRATTRKQPDPNSLTEKEAEHIRRYYFQYHQAVCPRDDSQLRIHELQLDEQKTPTLVISCPFCGLSERLEGLV